MRSFWLTYLFYLLTITSVKRAAFCDGYLRKGSKAVTHGNSGLAAFEPAFVITYFSPWQNESKENVTARVANLGVADPLIISFSCSVVALGHQLQSGSSVTPLKVSIVAPNGALIPVAGSGWWMTSAVYRFDPNGSWPPGRHIRVDLNSDLVSLSGQRLVFGGVGSEKGESSQIEGLPLSSFPRFFETPDLIIDVRDVKSETLSEISNGTWTPSLRYHWSSDIAGVYKAFEVPEDGEVTLSLNYPLPKALVASDSSSNHAKVLKIYEVKESSKDPELYEQVPSSVPFKTYACQDVEALSGSESQNDTTKCVKLSFPTAALPTGKLFNVRSAFERPTISSNLKRGSSREMSFLTGLRPFEFRSPRKVVAHNTRLALGLNYGLDDAVTPSVVSQITSLKCLNKSVAKAYERLTSDTSSSQNTDAPECFCPSMSLAGGLKVRIDGKRRLLIEYAGFLPHCSYVLDFASSETVKDGLGRSLQASSIQFDFDPAELSKLSSPFVDRNANLFFLKTDHSRSSRKRAQSLFAFVSRGRNSLTWSMGLAPLWPALNGQGDWEGLMSGFAMASRQYYTLSTQSSDTEGAVFKHLEEFPGMQVRHGNASDVNAEMSVTEGEWRPLYFPEKVEVVSAESENERLNSEPANYFLGFIGTNTESFAEFSAFVIARGPLLQIITQDVYSARPGCTKDSFARVYVNAALPGENRQRGRMTVRGDTLTLALVEFYTFVGQQKLQQLQLNTSQLRSLLPEPRVLASKVVKVQNSLGGGAGAEGQEIVLSAMLELDLSLWKAQTAEALRNAFSGLKAASSDAEGEPLIEADQILDWESPSWVVVAQTQDGKVAGLSSVFHPNVFTCQLYEVVMGIPIEPDGERQRGRLREKACSSPEVTLPGSAYEVCPDNIFGDFTTDRVAIARNSTVGVHGDISVFEIGEQDRSVAALVKQVAEDRPVFVVDIWPFARQETKDSADDLTEPTQDGAEDAERLGLEQQLTSRVCAYSVSQVSAAGTIDATFRVPGRAMAGLTMQDLSSLLVFLPRSSLSDPQALKAFDKKDVVQGLAAVGEIAAALGYCSGPEARTLIQQLFQLVNGAFGGSLVLPINTRLWNNLVVTNPRPPSAVLTLSVPSLVGTSGVLKVEGSAESYLGRPLTTHKVLVKLNVPISRKAGSENGVVGGALGSQPCDTLGKNLTCELKRSYLVIAAELYTATFVDEMTSNSAAGSFRTPAIKVSDVQYWLEKHGFTTMSQRGKSQPLTVTVEASSLGLTGEPLSAKKEVTVAGSAVYFDRVEVVGTSSGAFPGTLVTLGAYLRTIEQLRGVDTAKPQKAVRFYAYDVVPARKGESLCDVLNETVLASMAELSDDEAVLSLFGALTGQHTEAGCSVATPRESTSGVGDADSHYYRYSCMMRQGNGRMGVVALGDFPKVSAEGVVMASATERSVVCYDPTYSWGSSDRIGRSRLSFDIRTPRLTSMSDQKVSFQFSNPLLGHINVDNVPEKVSLHYFWPFADIRSEERGVISLDVRESFRRAAIEDGQRFRRDYETATSFHVLLTVPKTCRDYLFSTGNNFPEIVGHSPCEVRFSAQFAPINPPWGSLAAERSVLNDPSASYVITGSATVSAATTVASGQENSLSSATREEAKVTVSLSGEDEIVGGGLLAKSDAQVRIRVKTNFEVFSKQTDRLVATASFFLVDKSFLDLAPLPSSSYNMTERVAELRRSVTQRSKIMDEIRNFIGESTSTAWNTLSESVFNRVIDILQRRWMRDPYVLPYNFPSGSDYWASYGAADVDLSDDEFLDRYVALLTGEPDYGVPWTSSSVIDGIAGPPMLMMRAARSSKVLTNLAMREAAPFTNGEDYAAEALKTRVEDGEALVLVRQVTLNRDAETAEFVGSFNIKVPDKLGLYVAKTFVTISELSTVEMSEVVTDRRSQEVRTVYGVSETELQSSTEVSLQPYTPRYLRQGDICYSGVEVSIDRRILGLLLVGTGQTAQRFTVEATIEGDVTRFSASQPPNVERLTSNKARASVVFSAESAELIQKALFQVEAPGHLGRSRTIYRLIAQDRPEVTMDSVVKEVEVVAFAPLVDFSTGVFLRVNSTVDWVSRPEVVSVPVPLAGTPGGVTISAQMGTGFFIAQLAARAVAKQINKDSREQLISLLQETSSSELPQVPAELPDTLASKSGVSSMAGGFVQVNSRRKRKLRKVAALDAPAPRLSGGSSWRFFGTNEMHSPTVSLNIPVESLLVALHARTALNMRAARDPAGFGDVSLAAEASVVLLGTYVIPAHVKREYWRTLEANPFGLLPYPWESMKEEILRDEKVEGSAGAYNNPVRLDFDLTGRAIGVLRTYISMREASILEGRVDDPRRRGSELDLLGTVLDSLRFDVQNAILYSYRRFSAIENLESSHFVEYFGLERWAKVSCAIGEPLNFTPVERSSNHSALSAEVFTAALKRRQSQIQASSICGANVEAALWGSLVATFLDSRERGIESGLIDLRQSCLDFTLDHVLLSGLKGYIRAEESDGRALSDLAQALTLKLWMTMLAEEPLTASQKQRISVSAPPLALFLSEAGLSKGVVGVLRFSNPTIKEVIDALQAFDRALVPSLFSLSSAEEGRGSSNAHSSSTNVTMKVMLSSSSKPILTGSLTAASPGPLSASKTWEDLGGDAAQNLTVSTHYTGEGRCFLFASASLVPDIDSIPPVYGGVALTKRYRLLDPVSDSCKDLISGAYKSGDVVCVEIKFVVKAPHRRMQIIDSTPSGFEPLEPTFSTTLDPLRGFGSSTVPPWVRGCGTPKVYASEGQVIWDCPSLGPGSLSLTYRAQVNLPGVYALPPVVADELGRPSTSSLSGGARRSIYVYSSSAVENHAPRIEELQRLYGVTEQVVPQFAEVHKDQPLKACPECAPDEMCNYFTGTCYSYTHNFTISEVQ